MSITGNKFSLQSMTVMVAFVVGMTVATTSRAIPVVIGYVSRSYCEDEIKEWRGST
jgi:hypothetical protein